MPYVWNFCAEVSFWLFAPRPTLLSCPAVLLRRPCDPLSSRCPPGPHGTGLPSQRCPPRAGPPAGWGARLARAAAQRSGEPPLSAPHDALRGGPSHCPRPRVGFACLRLLLLLLLLLLIKVSSGIDVMLRTVRLCWVVSHLSMHCVVCHLTRNLALCGTACTTTV